MIAARINATVSRMLDGRLLRMLGQLVHSLPWLLLASISVILRADRNWAPTAIMWIAAVGATLLACARRHTRVFQALLYRSIRSRTAAYIRAEKHKQQLHTDETKHPSTPNS
ncbi:MAG TPA: hypothetical protein VGC37_08580 [Friedmanniella sp.]